MLDKPMFVSRDLCISCGSNKLLIVAESSFGSEPVRSFIANDPWGENPLPVLEDKPWSLVECDECHQRFHRYILSPEWQEVRFSKWMSEEAIRAFEETHGTNDDLAIKHVQHVLRLKQRGVKRVLDFGCGFGQFLEMCRLFGMEAYGVDRSRERRSGAGVQIHASIDDVPGTFDAITMFEVLEHLDDPLAVVKELRKRLNPGGVMIVEVPDASGIDGISSRHEYHVIHPIEHINAFTPDTLVKIMERAGFKPLKKEAAFVTVSPKRVLKDLAKAGLKQHSTQRYFRAH